MNERGPVMGPRTEAGVPRPSRNDAVQQHVARVDMNPLSFGQMLRVLMVERSLTLAHMAALTGLHANVLSKIRLSSDPNSSIARNGKAFRPTPDTVARIIRGLNIIHPVPPQHVVQMFLKVGHAPPMPYVVSQFSTPEQIVVAFDGRDWIPEGGIHHDPGEPPASTASGVWRAPVHRLTPGVSLGLELDAAEADGRQGTPLVSADGDPPIRQRSGPTSKRDHADNRLEPLADE